MKTQSSFPLTTNPPLGQREFNVMLTHHFKQFIDSWLRYKQSQLEADLNEHLLHRDALEALGVPARLPLADPQLEATEPKPSTVEPLLLDRKQACELLRISKGTLRNRTKDGTLPFVKLRRRKLYPIEAIRAWIASATINTNGSEATLKGEEK